MDYYYYGLVGKEITQYMEVYAYSIMKYSIIYYLIPLVMCMRIESALDRLRPSLLIITKHCIMLPTILCVSIFRPRLISISASPGTVKWSFKLIFLWIIMFMFFCIFLQFRMYNYMYLCTNKSKNMTKITFRLIIAILRPAMSTNFTQNWREHCTYI